MQIEHYLFINSSPLEKLISFLLYPISLLYASISLIKRIILSLFKIKYDIAIISIGNISLGGSGKTPFLISLIKRLNLQNTAIILRGYKRKSKGLVIVNHNNNILCDSKTSGDEAMLYATSLKQSIVIVSENRINGINKAKEMGAKYIFLDDGFSKSNIEKYDILLESNDIKNKRLFPSGAMREFSFVKKQANLILQENIDYKRKVKIPKIEKDTILITSISKPYRLDSFLNKEIKKIYFPDHSLFSKEDIVNICQEHNSNSILCTTKDYVKLKDLNLEYKIFTIDLDIQISDDVFMEIQGYINHQSSINN